MPRRKTFILTILLVLLSACENTQRCDVPSYPVMFTMNILSEYPHFVPDNGYQTLTFTQKRYARDLIGYAGLLVWVDMEGKYNACDMCCPHCLDPQNPVYVDGIWAVCPACDEHFDLSYGLAIPTKGVTRQALRRFSVINRGGTLTIRN